MTATPTAAPAPLPHYVSKTPFDPQSIELLSPAQQRVYFASHPLDPASKWRRGVQRDPIAQDRAPRRRGVRSRTPSQSHPLRGEHARKDFFVSFLVGDLEK